MIALCCCRPPSSRVERRLTVVVKMAASAPSVLLPPSSDGRGHDNVVPILQVVHAVIWKFQMDLKDVRPAAEKCPLEQHTHNHCVHAYHVGKDARLRTTTSHAAPMHSLSLTKIDPTRVLHLNDESGEANCDYRLMI